MSATFPTERSDAREAILATGQRLMAGKGFSAVGLNEILATAKVPKGSFYHYFASKEAFGEAMLDRYFDDYLADIDNTLNAPGLTMAARLDNYWHDWQHNQSFLDCQGKCLAVKLAAEVADLSDAMRRAMERGTSAIVGRLARALDAGVAEGTMSIDGDPLDVAANLYQLWLGASVMVKIHRHREPFASALRITRQILHISA
jgi:TetR/AcrR family transcriptional repressor of nem operon